jgi:carboxyl-terminal processing protease
MVVLIDGGSASASEILAGAIKENERGQIVGTRSYGKGTVQVVEELYDGSVLKMTVAEWLTPDGNNISKNGIEPNMVVEDENTDGKDIQLEKAKELLKQ